MPGAFSIEKHLSKGVNMNFKELRLRRLRHGITARQMAEHLGASYGWVRQLEKGHYRGPCVPMWRERYKEALQVLIDAKRHINKY